MDRYRQIEEYRTEEGVRYRRNPIYPDIPEHEEDLYVITTGGDRYDTLANQFYNDPTLWWIIASANNYNKDSLAITPGVQLRIPADRDGTILEYYRINNIR
jgi:hypothetical protein